VAQTHRVLSVRARVLVRPKAGILDPQGQAVERALPALGFSGVRNVHVGRLIELDVEDPERLPEMCERLLSNPLIEDYEVEVTRSATGQAEPEAERRSQDAGPEARRRTP
jgi:phosphoribosylformylglycinamidine synthase subunit PurS